MNLLLILILSFTAMLWSSTHVVNGAAGIASYLRVPALIIGLTIVAIGTSAPEMVVAITAALEGHANLAISSAVGSNIANIGLVLGLTILIRPPTMQTSLLRREYPLLFVIMIFTYLLMIDGYLSSVDGVLLLSGTIALIGYFAYQAKSSSQSYINHDFREAVKAKKPMIYNVLSIIFGLILLPISAHYLIDSAVDIAKLLGISEEVIGLTIISIGTSMPEISTSVVAAIKEESDIAIGTILGSNMVNLITVLIFPAIINPSPISKDILWRDMPMMFAITLIILLINYHYKKQVSRLHGALLLLIYCSYIISLI